MRALWMHTKDAHEEGTRMHTKKTHGCTRRRHTVRGVQSINTYKAPTQDPSVTLIRGMTLIAQRDTSESLHFRASLLQERPDPTPPMFAITARPTILA